MNVGSRVHTPDGQGTITRFVIDHRWAFRRTNALQWVIVQLDGKPYGQVFLPSQVKEAPMNEQPDQTSGVLIQAPENTTEPAPEPDPTEPQPEPADGDDDNEQLIEFPE